MCTQYKRQVSRETSFINTLGMHFTTICFLGILSASITVVIGQELPFQCLQSRRTGNFFGYYKPLFQSCESVLESIKTWIDAKCAVGFDAKCNAKCAGEFDAKCDAKCDAKLILAVNSYYYKKRRSLAFELTDCLKAKGKATCDTKQKCFWLPEGNCVPKDLVP